MQDRTDELIDLVKTAKSAATQARDNAADGILRNDGGLTLLANLKAQGFVILDPNDGRTALALNAQADEPVNDAPVDALDTELAHANARVKIAGK